MKPALITGGARRVGKAISLGLAERGHDIALHFRSSTADAKETADEIRTLGVRCELLQADLLDPEEVAKLIPRAKKLFPGLGVLINNASTFKPATILESDAQIIDFNFAIHVRAPFLLTRDFAKHCGKGLVINMLDTNITNNRSTHAAYLLSKKALASFTQMAAKELAPDIRVNAIAPGLILPPKGEPKAYLDTLLKQVPLHRKGSPQDVVNALVFLLEHDYLTGQIIYVDGGEHL